LTKYQVMLAAGLAVLGITAAGAWVVASPGGEEEVVQQVETATPSPDASETATPAASPAPGPLIELPSPSPSLAACDPNPPAPLGTKLWRWGDLTIIVPDEIQVQGDLFALDVQPNLILFPREVSGAQTHIDARTGAVVRHDPKGYYEPVIQAALATISIRPFDPTTAPWPYNGERGERPRVILGNVSYLEPDPASGIQVVPGGACGDSTSPGGGGCRGFLGVGSTRSRLGIDAGTGEVFRRDIAPEDEAAFQRFLAEVQLIPS